MRDWQQRWKNRQFQKSLKTCDLINVANYDELEYVRNVLGLTQECVVFPFGLSSERREKLVKAAQSPEVRLAKKEVVFIGTWEPRKGSRDWKEIITTVKSQIPSVKFLFLGTGISAEKVLVDLGFPVCDWIRIIPNYESKELPGLLSESTVGAFPSYIEGFGFAVLEKLACGLPTVAYDVPGPREMIKFLDSSLLVKVGNTEQFSHKLIDLLSIDGFSYNQFSQKCIEVSKKFSWENIAQDTLLAYQPAYQNIRSRFL